MADATQATDGSRFDLDTCTQTLTYNGDGTLASIQAVTTIKLKSYTQTYTYTAGKVTTISAWIPQ